MTSGGLTASFQWSGNSTSDGHNWQPSLTLDVCSFRRQEIQILTGSYPADECPVLPLPLIFSGNDCMCVTDLFVTLDREIFLSVLQKQTYQHTHQTHCCPFPMTAAQTNGLQWPLVVVWSDAHNFPKPAAALGVTQSRHLTAHSTQKSNIWVISQTLCRRLRSV